MLFVCSSLRQTHEFYKLVVKGTDMKGGAGGKTGTGTVEIRVLDINDNVPTLEKSEVNIWFEFSTNQLNKTAITVVKSQQ